MTICNKQLKKTAAAARAGLMIGDALGAPAEFCYHEDILAKYPDGLCDMVPGFCICTDRLPAEVTDDTQMAYCLHRPWLAAVHAANSPHSVLHPHIARAPGGTNPPGAEVIAAGLRIIRS